MWIEHTRKTDDGSPAVRALKAPGIDERVEFSDNGKANVTKDVGEYLVDMYPDVIPAEEDDETEDEEPPDEDETEE